MDWRKGAPTPQDKKPGSPVLKGTANGSVAIGVPSFGTRESFDVSSEKQWRYHIKKHQNDLYLATNPDSEHVNSPVAPSYYVSIAPGGPNSNGQIGFTMSFVDPTKQFCEITVTRLFNPEEQEYYEVIVFKKPQVKTAFDEFDFGPSRKVSSTVTSNGEEMVKLARQITSMPGGIQLSAGLSEVAWTSCALLRPQGADATNAGSKSTMLGKKGHALRQFELKDERGRKWVVGNRAPQHNQHHHQYYTDGGSRRSFDDDSDDDDTLRIKTKSSNVYFFMPGLRGPESDKIMAVLQRGKQAKNQGGSSSSSSKSVLPSMQESQEENDQGTFNVGASPKRRGFFKSVASSGGNSGSPIGSPNLDNGGTSSGGGGSSSLEEDDTSSSSAAAAAAVAASNYGWLTMYENVKRRPGMWTVVTALTVAVSYGQRVDGKEKSVSEKLKRLGRKYMDSRKQVYYGHHRHTQSLV